MVSAEALAALAALEQGATFNTTHTIARELMALSLAFEDFGRLQITEQGRVYLRRSNTHRVFIPAAEFGDLQPAERGHREPGCHQLA